MASSSCGSRLAFFTCLWILVVESEALHPRLTVMVGEDALLQCRVPGGAAVDLLEWTRTESGKNQNVFVWRNGKMDEEDQHERFRGRVNLTDVDMNDGNVSVVLNNATIKDSGLYGCRVGNGGGPDLINTVLLTVEHGPTESEGEAAAKKGGGQSYGHVTPVVCVSLIVVLLAALVTFEEYKRRRPKWDAAPPEDGSDQLMRNSLS